MKRKKNTPKKINHNKFGQAGANLIEALIFIAIGLLLLLGVIGIYKLVSSGSKESAATSQIIATQISYRGAYGGQNSYGTGDITDSKNLPSDLKVSGTTVKNGWDGAVTITGASAVFTISWAGVSDVSCAKIAILNADWLGVSINGSAQTLPVTTAAAKLACTNGNNTIVYTSN